MTEHRPGRSASQDEAALDAIGRVVRSVTSACHAEKVPAGIGLYAVLHAALAIMRAQRADLERAELYRLAREYMSIVGEPPTDAFLEERVERAAMLDANATSIERAALMIVRAALNANADPAPTITALMVVAMMVVPSPGAFVALEGLRRYRDKFESLRPLPTDVRDIRASN